MFVKYRNTISHKHLLNKGAGLFKLSLITPAKMFLNKADKENKTFQHKIIKKYLPVYLVI